MRTLLFKANSVLTSILSALTLPKIYDEDIKQISSGNTTIIIFFGDFAGMVLKLEKVSPTFSSCNPCPSFEFH